VPSPLVRNRSIASALLATALIAGASAGAGADEGRHTVRNGETLSEIAAANRLSVRELAAANAITNPDRVLIGQVLVIPGAAAATPATVVHVVAPGETLSGIAARYGTTTRALADANGIRNRDLVRIGARLTVPAGSGSASGGAAATSTTHTVASGETLGGIASRYRTSVGAIVSANSLNRPDVIRIGQQLTIPAGSGSGSSGGGGAAGTSAYGATGSGDGRTGVAGTHTVVRGDTLAGIAGRYGVSTEALAVANGIVRPWNLYADARLVLSAPNRLPVDIGTCPVPGASYVNDWGFPRSGGRAHSGTDLFAPRGTPVLAPVSGVVTFATGTIGGKQFRLVGDDGMLYLGSHLDGFGTSGRVERGATIGYVGSSGNAAGGRPHLHFEVHPDGGAAMNPYPVVRLAC
jgi:LysM repeat protein